MFISFQAIWPSEVPENLWNFERLNPAVDQFYPMLGNDFGRNFILAFAVGILIILFYGRMRFNELSYDPDAVDYRVIRELAPRELRGPSLMRQAYWIYAFGLVIAYVLFSFFGRLILSMLELFGSVLPIAGVKLASDGTDFSSPQWPLLIAAGFAGLAPLLPPLVIFEGWLRRQAHGFVGLPILLSSRTRKLLLNMSPSEAEAVARENGEAGSLAAGMPKEFEGWDLGRPENLSPWVETHISQLDTVQGVFEARDEVELLLRWSNEQRDTEWPREEVRSELYRLEREEAREASAALQQFEDVIVRDYDEAPDEKLLRKRQRDHDTLQAHRKKLEDNLTESIEKLRRIRGEMAAILVVYAERDPAHSKIHDTYLRELIEETFDTPFKREGPERGLLVFLCFAFAIYAAGVATGWHNLVGNGLHLITVLGTAGLETTRLACLLVLPVFVACSFRMLKIEKGEDDYGQKFWEPIRLPHKYKVKVKVKVKVEDKDKDEYEYKEIEKWSAGLNRRSMKNLFWIAVWSIIASALSVSLLAMAWSALISENNKAYFEILLENQVPYLWYFATLSVVSIPQVFFVLLALDSGGSSGSKAEKMPDDLTATDDFALGKSTMIFGVMSAVFVFVLMLAHLHFWFGKIGGPWCPSPDWWPSESFTLVPSKLCMNWNGGLDFLLYSLAAFFASGVFVGNRLSTSESGEQQVQDDSGTNGSSPRTAMIFLALFVLGAVTASNVLAEEDPSHKTFCTTKANSTDVKCVSPDLQTEEIKVGFRSDAAPFSYRILVDGEPRFVGYLADLCYRIFQGSKYSVVSVPISASSRYKQLRKPEDVSNDGTDPEKVDVLCDPTTLRFSSPGEIQGTTSPQGDDTLHNIAPEIQGLFSPIVFVSGVSFLRRTASPRGGASDPVLLGYVGDTTALDVAYRACFVNTFGVEDENGNPPDCGRIADIRRRANLKIEGEAAAVTPEGGENGKTVAKSCNAFNPTSEKSQTPPASDVEAAIPESSASEQEEQVEEKPTAQYEFCPFKSHADLIRWFCSEATDGEGARVPTRELAYFGDRDIILAKLRAWVGTNVTCGGGGSKVDPKIESERGTFTYEPYSIVVTKTNADLYQHVQRRIYEFFSHRDEARAHFRAYFPDQQMSAPLAYLFILNAVTSEDTFKFSSSDNGDALVGEGGQSN